jgi:hypothetical protein
MFSLVETDNPVEYDEYCVEADTGSGGTTRGMGLRYAEGTERETSGFEKRKEYPSLDASFRGRVVRVECQGRSR